MIYVLKGPLGSIFNDLLITWYMRGVMFNRISEIEVKMTLFLDRMNKNRIFGVE